MQAKGKRHVVEITGHPQREKKLSMNRQSHGDPLVADWLFSYRKDWLRPDLIAGITTAVVVIPKAMAYATNRGSAGPGRVVHRLGPHGALRRDRKLSPTECIAQKIRPLVNEAQLRWLRSI